MKHYAIVIKDNDISEFGYDRMVKSSVAVGNDFDIERFNAITPEYVDYMLATLGLKWNYPWEGIVQDFATGLTKSAYVTANPKARIACALSHFVLWDRCLQTNEDFLILEHDTMFTKKLDLDFSKTKLDIIGINNPLGATRKASMYYDTILQNQNLFQLTPKIDSDNIPQGLAGNSAYVMKPKGAEHMINLVRRYGLWPNDAIMCRQLVPMLGVTREFFTTVGNMRSTTTR